jgi:hypothetical protein
MTAASAPAGRTSARASANRGTRCCGLHGYAEGRGICNTECHYNAKSERNCHFERPWAVSSRRYASVICSISDGLCILATRHRRDEIDNAPDKTNSAIPVLLALLDREQHSHLRNHFLDAVNIDLSKSFFICAAKNLADISPLLLDQLIRHPAGRRSWSKGSSPPDKEGACFKAHAEADRGPAWHQGRLPCWANRSRYDQTLWRCCPLCQWRKPMEEGLDRVAALCGCPPAREITA